MSQRYHRRIKFVDKWDYNKRCTESKNILHKYPNRIPCIVEIADNAPPTLSEIDKNKFLVPDDITFGNLLYIVRKRLRLEHNHALYMFLNDSTLPPTSARMRTLYDLYKSNCGFLYITYNTENTFGCSLRYLFKNKYKINT